MTAELAPKVSVVIPMRDDAQALDLCLSLLARQTIAPLEIVVVDNASTDSSAAVAHRWGAVVVDQLRITPPFPARPRRTQHAPTGES